MDIVRTGGALTTQRVKAEIISGRFIKQSKELVSLAPYPNVCGNSDLQFSSGRRTWASPEWRNHTDYSSSFQNESVI